mgnify:CR=1 FL=1
MAQTAKRQTTVQSSRTSAQTPLSDYETTLQQLKKALSVAKQKLKECESDRELLHIQVDEVLAQEQAAEERLVALRRTIYEEETAFTTHKTAITHDLQLLEQHKLALQQEILEIEASNQQRRTELADWELHLQQRYRELHLKEQKINLSEAAMLRNTTLLEL